LTNNSSLYISIIKQFIIYYVTQLFKCGGQVTSCCQQVWTVESCHRPTCIYWSGWISCTQFCKC